MSETAITADKKHKIKKADIPFNVVNYLLFAIFAIICTYPFYYLIIKCHIV